MSEEVQRFVFKDTYPCIRLRYTLGNHFLVAFLVACVSTVLALVSGRIEQELVAEGAQDDLIELPLDELVSVHFVDLVLALANSTLTSETARRI